MMLRLTWLPLACLAMLLASAVTAKTDPLLDADQLEARWQQYADRSHQTSPA